MDAKDTIKQTAKAVGDKVEDAAGAVAEKAASLLEPPRRAPTRRPPARSRAPT
jgi:hypothetical protein